MQFGSFSTSNTQAKVTLKLFELLTLRCRLFHAQRFFFGRLRKLATKLNGAARIGFQSLTRCDASDGLYRSQRGLGQPLFVLLTLR
jgi:hypothetical protein